MFTIHQSKNLSGTVRVSWSKNAALPLLGAQKLVNNVVHLSNVPDILDVRRLKEVIGIADAQSWNFYDLTDELVTKMRASILLIPYGLRQYGSVKLLGSGGCKLWKRSLDTFDDAFEQCGVSVEDEDYKVYTVTWKPQSEVILAEFSVTTIEAILTYLAFHDDIEEVTVRQIAIEPHVVNLIDFLNACGADITLGYDHSVVVKKATINPTVSEFAVVWDYLETALFLGIGALAENSSLTVTGCPIAHQTKTLYYAKQIWIDITILNDQTFTVTSKNKANYQAPKKIESRLYPWFPTDILPKFIPILTQCHGITRVFETLFEWRFAYLNELENLWANIEILNPHQVLIIWPTPLKWNYVSSTDIRGWGAVLIAWVIAEWKTMITNEEMILRWYDNVIEKLQSIGVSIEHSE